MMLAAVTFEVLDHTAAFGLSQGSCDPTQGCWLGTQLWGLAVIP